MFEDVVREKVSQGDIFLDFPIVYFGHRTDEKTGNRVLLQPVVRTVPVMFISYDCEYDKDETMYVAVAEILPLESLRENERGNIKKHKAFNALYLENCKTFPDSFVDFRRIERVTKAVVKEYDDGGHRKESLTMKGRQALRYKISQFFGLRPNAEL